METIPFCFMFIQSHKYPSKLFVSGEMVDDEMILLSTVCHYSFKKNDAIMHLSIGPSSIACAKKDGGVE